MSLRPIPRSEHVRSGVYALVFAPVALIFMGSSMADLQAQAAVGLPLASVEGLIGVALATIILALVSLNCEESPAGMYVTSALSIPIGLSQAAGYLRVPLLQSTIFDLPDMRSSVLWSLYPLSVTLITGCAAVALTYARYPAVKIDSLVPYPAITGHRHTWVASLSIPATLIASVLFVLAAPNDTSAVSANGLSALEPAAGTHALETIIAAILLGLTALVARFSLTGPQAGAWLIMAIPTYMLVPLWSSITGSVVTPGPSVTTQLALASPVIASLGCLLGASTMGIYVARQRVSVGDEATQLDTQRDQNNGDETRLADK